MIFDDWRYEPKPDITTYTASDIKGGELYDLQSDPQEWDNLYDATAQRELRGDLTKKLLQHLKTITAGEVL